MTPSLDIPSRATRPHPTRAPFAFAVLLLALGACSSGSSAPPAIGIAAEPVVGSADDLPGVMVTIGAVRGGSGPGGNVRVGDRLEVDFSVGTHAGAPLELSTFARGAIMVSGPTNNYQRVIAPQSDVIDVARKFDLGSYTYGFEVPIPAAYLAPLNDTAAFVDNELTGQALLSGTYTVGIELRKDYVIDGDSHRDPGNATVDFLLGDATAVEKREVVTLANCNQCHGELNAHGENRNAITNCLLCHTPGSEDGNDPLVAGGTPGINVDFRVLIHKIHSGSKLPSVNGVATNPDGSRDYGAAPKPYVVMGYRSSLHDFSEIALPIWPSMVAGMPRDAGYTGLTTAQKAQENAILGGPIGCAKCHGDPDGAGPLPPPAQGDLAYTQPTRAACASCHDDWNPDLPYTANNQTMPIQRDDAACKHCHRESGTPLDVRDAHRHPLLDALLAPGVVFDVQSVTDIGGTPNGKFDAGEKMQVSLTIKDESGNDIAASSLARMEIVLNGPTTNPNLLHFVRIGTDGLGAGPTYTFNVPQAFYYEPAGSSSSTTGGQAFATSRAPHWNVANAATSVLLRTGISASSTLADNAPALQNFIDVATGTGATFARDDYIVIEDLVAGRREYLKVQNVEGDRLWFSSAYTQSYAPGLRTAHAAGSSVDQITRLDVPASSYVLDAVTGIVTETTEFGDGEVLISYTADFVVPANYPGAFNESPDLDQSWGDWVGLPLLSGTYNFGVYGARSFTVTASGENTTYREASQPHVQQLLFGTATSIQTVARIDSAAGCNRCHEDIQFHGSYRRGFDTCILCHGTAGAEDSPSYVYAGAAPTTGTTIDFRTMIHKIHHGKELDQAASYAVNGFGGASHRYDDVGFPIIPGGTTQCAVCHGDDNEAWVEPADRFHPAAGVATRTWRAACGSCHDSNAERAHIDVNTSLFGLEACAICHGAGKEQDVRAAHKTR